MALRSCEKPEINSISSHFYQQLPEHSNAANSMCMSSMGKARSSSSTRVHTVLFASCMRSQKYLVKSTQEQLLLLSLSEVKPVRVVFWKCNTPFPHDASKARTENHIRFSQTDVFSVKDEFSKLLKSKCPEIRQEIKEDLDNSLKSQKLWQTKTQTIPS